IRKMLAKLVDSVQNPDVLLSAGIFYERIGELDKAESIFNELLLDNLKFTGARYELARIYLSKGKIDAAIKELETAILYDPEAQDVLNLLGEIHYQKGDLEQAGIRFREVLKLNPENKSANYNLGNIHYSFDQMDEAIRSYEKASALGYEAASMDYNSGAAYYLTGRYQEAADRWKKLIKKDDPVVFYNLGNAHLYLGHWKEADDNLGKAIDYYLDVLSREIKVERPEDEDKIFRTLGRAYNNQGIAKEKTGQEREAMLNYFKALEAASWGEGEDETARVNLDRVLKGEPLVDLEKAIHPQVEKEHKVAMSNEL
ncbi:tetratricopeptide repeat protein, partial [bacterium]|nr:tetratricopeptide repeat protein [bacterium]MBU1615184.1 tetratricopeptide repeat protein [bacterium]